jgi:hypothetical protein
MGVANLITLPTSDGAAFEAGLQTRGAGPGGPIPQDPLAPRRGPLGSSPDRQSAIGNAPALVPGP